MRKSYSYWKTANTVSFESQRHKTGYFNAKNYRFSFLIGYFLDQSNNTVACFFQAVH